MTKDAGMPKKTVELENEDLSQKNIHRNIAERISKYISDNNLTQNQFAEKIGVSSSTVNRWAGYNTAATPPVHCLKKIADTICITVDSLITGSDVLLARPKFRTYSSAFLSLVELVNNALIQPESEDPFLNWLISKKVTIDHMGRVSKARKDTWISKVVSDYDKPLLPKYLTQYIELFKNEYTEIEEYDTYLTVFRLFQGYASGETKDVVDGLIQQWHNSIIQGTDEFRRVKVPYDGGDQLYALDENGKTILTDFPEKEICVEINPNDILDEDAMPNDILDEDAMPSDASRT